MPNEAPDPDDRAVVQTNNWDEILSTARTYQYDRYIAATLSPRSARPDLIVLAAFAGEMRRIPWAVSDPTIGMIRLQWWRDCLTAGASTATGNPLADAVNDVMAREGLPVGLLLGHIDAQETELYADLLEDMDQLRLHFNKREGGLFQLAARRLGATEPLPEGNRAAFAYGMSKTIAEFGFRRQGRQLLVPRDLAVQYQVEPGAEPDTGSPDDNARALLTALSKFAIKDYEACRDALGSEMRKVRSALLPLTLTRSYAATAKGPFDAANVLDTGSGNFTKSCRMLLAHLRGRI